VNHSTLGHLLSSVIEAGFRLERVDEPGEDEYPMLLALRATG